MSEATVIPITSVQTTIEEIVRRLVAGQPILKRLRPPGTP